MTRAVVLDLDGTLVSSYADPRSAWTAIAAELAPRFGRVDPAVLGEAVTERAKRFFSADANRRLWRLDPLETRRAVVRAAFAELAEAGLVLPDDLARAMADRYEGYRDETMTLIEGALDLLERLAGEGHRLALLTNGTARVQRRKLARFDLERHFEYVAVEEELGFGKPDPRVFTGALVAMGLEPHAVAMVGDDWRFDIVPALALGMKGALFDPDGRAGPDARGHAFARLRDLPERLAAAR